MIDEDNIFTCICGNPKIRVRGLGMYCRDCDDHIFSPSSKEELTNGGKPHMCNTLQVFNGGKDSVSLCTKCNMPVDSSKEGEWDWEKDFDSMFRCTWKDEYFDNTPRDKRIKYQDFIHQNFVPKSTLEGLDESAWEKAHKLMVMDSVIKKIEGKKVNYVWENEKCSVCGKDIDYSGSTQHLCEVIDDLLDDLLTYLKGEDNK